MVNDGGVRWSDDCVSQSTSEVGKIVSVVNDDELRLVCEISFVVAIGATDPVINR